MKIQVASVTVTKLLFCLLLVFGLSSCERKPRSDGRTVLRLAHGMQTNQPVHLAMEVFAKEVETLSHGKMKIEIYPSEQLGAEKECLELCQMGVLDMAKASAAPLEGFIEEMKVFGLPYLFRDNEHMWKVFDGPIAEEILKAGESRGLLGLCFYDAGIRSFYTTTKPIREPADLKGMKIRVQKSDMAIRMIKAMGGSPTPIDWGELYNALQQGVVDGAENNRPSFQRSQHYKACKYYTLDEHLRQPDVLMISSNVWKKLKPEQQQILKRAIKSSVQFQREQWQKSAVAAMKIVRDSGVEIITPDQSKFREAVKPLWEEFKTTRVGQLAAEIQAVR